jgi:dTDP-glucose 4,6-dehydratase
VRRLLVTGGAGFIGSNFVHYWLREHAGDRVVVLDALTYAGNARNLEGVRERAELRFVHADIGDTELVQGLLRDEQLDTIVHFAAESHVDRSIAGPGVFVRTNVLGTHSLLEAARRVWLEERRVERHRFHHVSTDEVFGSLGATDPEFHEGTPYAPNSPYSASKAASDHLVRAYHHTYGLDVLTSNCSNNYGPYQFPEKLIPLAIVSMLEGRSIPIYGDGRNRRDWLHVEDHCRALDLTLASAARGEVFCVGGRSECENIVLIRELCAICDALFREDATLAARFPRCPAARGAQCAELIGFVKDREGHDRRYAIDGSKLARELGFAPSVTLHAGLGQTLRWYLANEAWWRGVMDGSYRQWLETQYGAERAGTRVAAATHHER